MMVVRVGSDICLEKAASLVLARANQFRIL